MDKKTLATKGFTLIELLVVISIIGLLASIVTTQLSTAKEKAKVTKAVSQVRQLENAIAMYISDTGIYPQFRCDSYCNAAADPFTVSRGVAGWKGPYKPAPHETAHPWGGQVTYQPAGPLVTDFDHDGTRDYLIILDDDTPGSGLTVEGDNAGQIPATFLKMIDGIIDDGQLNTGNARSVDFVTTDEQFNPGLCAGVGAGNSTRWELCCVTGELCIKLRSL